jgi:hypothetical protein
MVWCLEAWATFTFLNSPSGMLRMDSRDAPDKRYSSTDVVRRPVHLNIGMGRI